MGDETKCTRCRYDRFVKDARDGIVCRFCGLAEMQAEPPRLDVARFYFADGRTQIGSRPDRSVYLVREFNDHDFALDGALGSLDFVEHVFERREYAYDATFIGPTRDADWHERAQARR